MPSSGEWLVLLVVGLLIFGRRLPEVGKSVAKTLSQFRRGLHDFKRELDKDEDLRDVKSTVHEFKKAVDAPRILAHPSKILDAVGEMDMDEEEGELAEGNSASIQKIAEPEIAEAAPEAKETEKDPR